MRSTVSEQLRGQRERLGWSLGTLAQRADTSAATLSRYENGWTRFEVYTLTKLAAALGCELRIDLVPTPARPAKTRSSRMILRQLRRLFWDCRISERDLEPHRTWIVERVLEYGQLKDVLALQELYGRSRFLETVAGASRWSERTGIFWSHMLKKEGVTCTKKYSRPKA